MNILKLLNLRRSEVPRLVHAAAIFFLVSVNDGIIKSVAAAVFNIRQGVEHLPLMYTWIAVVFSLCMALLSWLTAKVARQRLLFALLAAGGFVLIFNTGMLVLEHRGTALGFLGPIFYPLLFISSELARNLVGFQIWIVAGYICYTSRAKVLFPLLAASATLGDIGGGFVVRFLGNLLESYQLYGLSALNMGLVILLMRSLSHRYFVDQQEGGERGASLIENLRYIGRSPFLQLLFVLSIAVFAFYTSIHYSFNVIGRENFPSEREFTSLFGLFYGVTGIGTLVVATLLLQRLLRWLGTGNVYLWVCAVYGLVALVLLGVFEDVVALPPVGAIFAFNLINFLLLDSVVAPTYQVLIKMVPQRHSDGTRMIMEGGFMLLGGLAGAGLTSLHARNLLSLSGLCTTLLGLSIAMVVCGWLLKKSYTQVLVRAVREQDIDVEDEQAMATLNRHIARSAEFSRELLLHRDDGVRQMGIDILRRNPGPWVEQTCTPLIDHENPRIRSAALEALSADGQGVSHLLPCLDDEDEEVRLSAAGALARLIGANDRSASEELGSEQCRGVAAAVLPRLAKVDRGTAEYLVILERLEHEESRAQRQRLLVEMLDSEKVDERIDGIQGARRMGAVVVRERIILQLEHPHPGVREAAVDYLGDLGLAEGFAALLKILGDPDPDVAQATARALSRLAQEQGQEVLLQRLQVCPLKEWKVLLTAFVEIDDQRLTRTLMDSCYQRLVEANRRLVAIERLQAEGETPALELLIDQLKGQNLVVQDGTVTLLGYLGDVGVVGDLLERLSETDEEARENAIELLENIADRELMGHLLPLLEKDAEVQLRQAMEISNWEEVNVEAVLGHLLRNPDSWTQMAGVWTAGEMDLLPLLAELPDEPAPHVVESVAEIERKRGGTMAAEELPLTTMEKITFLKGCEFFAALPLEELYHIAVSMEEESVKTGTTVIEEGTLGDKMYIVVSGELEVKRKDGQRVAVLGEKQVVGDMALLDDEPRSATVVALEEVHLLSLQRSSLERILRRYSSIAFNMMRILSQRLRNAMAG
jgi:HEAT repeat protein